MLALHVLGGLTLKGPNGLVLGRASQRRRLVLLAILTHARGRVVSRDRLVALLWPESDTGRARHLLADSVYVLRAALGEDIVLSVGPDLAINPEKLSSDLEAFFRDLDDGDLASAVARYALGGPFLDGVHVSEAPELERWVDATRSQLAETYRDALESLALEATTRGDSGAAVVWWRRLAAEDPLSSRVALSLMRALADDGDVAGALEHGRTHERVVRTELESAPDPSVLALMHELRAPSAAEHGTGVANAGRPGEPAVSASDTRAPEVASSTTSHRPMLSRRLAWALVGVTAFSAWLIARRPVAGGPAVHRHTPSIAAFELYQRGRDPTLLRNDSSVRVGLDYFRQAIAEDPTYAAAYAGLADMYATLGIADNAGMPHRTLYSLAEQAALKAVALDDQLAESHAALGFARLGLFDLASGEAELKRALDLDPADPRTHEYLLHLYLLTGRQGEALAAARRARDADPLSAAATGNLASALYMSGRFDEALGELKRIADVRPHLRRAAFVAGLCYIAKGQWTEAEAEFRKNLGKGGKGGVPPRPVAMLAYIDARSGRRSEALRLLADLADRRHRDSTGAFELVVAYTGLRDFDHAFVWLNHAAEDRAIWLEVMGPLFADLRADKRFEHVRQLLGLPSG